MEIINRVDNLAIIYPNIILTMGNFDGVHLGHRKIIKRVVSHAAQTEGTSVALTFHPHPSKILTPSRKLDFLTTPKEQEKVFRSLGLDLLLIIEFNREFSRLTPSEFIADILSLHLKIKLLVIGPDHSFGRDRAGGVGLLKEMAPCYGYRVEVVQPLRVQDFLVSSTSIRNLLAKGEVEKASHLLGRPYEVGGKVFRREGAEEDRSLLSLVEVDAHKLIPPDGNYCLELKGVKEGSPCETELDCHFTSSYTGGDHKRIDLDPLEGNIKNLANRWSQEIEIRFEKRL